MDDTFSKDSLECYLWKSLKEVHIYDPRLYPYGEHIDHLYLSVRKSFWLMMFSLQISLQLLVKRLLDEAEANKILCFTLVETNSFWSLHI